MVSNPDQTYTRLYRKELGLHRSGIRLKH